MRYLLNAKESKYVDEYSIGTIGIPSLVLMERAALAVTNQIMKWIEQRNSFSFETQKCPSCKILCVCGSGNNGADGIAVARQLKERQMDVHILYAAGTQKQGTPEYEVQKNIAYSLNIPTVKQYEQNQYTIVVDALFGIGLSREIAGDYYKLIEKINGDSARIYAVDIPSGVNATDGKVMGMAVKAQETVTFGYEKLGLVLYPGADHAGEVIIAEIGFAGNAVENLREKVFTYDDDDFKNIPERKKDGNKGTYGKILIAAGSKTMGGAAVFSGLAAYRSGAGLVKFLTHCYNHDAILQYVPECLMTLYSEETIEKGNQLSEMVRQDCNWASCVVAGPGISQDDCAVELITSIMKETDQPLIIDADGLNIIAKYMNTGYGKNKKMIITPHVGEMARLTGLSIDEIKEDLIGTAKSYAKKEGVVCVLKDARTIVTDGEQVYVNTSGCDAMATGGSGDVLTGVIAGMITAGMSLFEAAAMGVFIHGRAGQMAGREMGNRGVTARDVADYVGKVLK